MLPADAAALQFRAIRLPQRRTSTTNKRRSDPWQTLSVFSWPMLNHAESVKFADEIANVAASSQEGAAFEAAGMYVLPVFVFGFMLRCVEESDEQVEELVVKN